MTVPGPGGGGGGKGGDLHTWINVYIKEEEEGDEEEGEKVGQEKELKKGERVKKKN